MSFGILKPDRNSFDNPFNTMEYEKEFCVENIFHRMPFQKTITFEYVGDFPNNISEYIFGGENVEADEWQLLGRLNNGLYFWYIASCDSTYFYDMKLYASTKLEYVINYAMGRVERKTFYSNINSRSWLELIRLISQRTMEELPKIFG